MSSFVPTPDWSPRTKRTVALLLLAAVVALSWFVRDVLPILIVSVVIAYLLSPVVSFLSRRVLIIPFLGTSSRRGCAALLAFILALITIIVVLLVLVPVLVDQIEEFGRSIPALVAGLESDVEQWLSQPLSFNNEPILLEGEPIVPLERIQEATGVESLRDLINLNSLNLTLTTAADTFIGSAGSLTGRAFSFLGGAFNTIINTTILLMMTFYLLKDGREFVSYIVDMVPDEHQPDAERIFYELGYVWNAYLRGQLLLCLIMGLSVYGAATLLGLPNAPLLGLLAGILEFIPNIGPFIALIPAAFLGLVSTSETFPFLQGLPFMLVTIVVWTGLQNIEAIVLVPRVMGDSLDLHPYVVIVAVLSGAAIAGALGVILAAPFVASARILFMYLYGKISGREPFPDRSRPTASTRPPLLARVFQRIARQVRDRLSSRGSAQRQNKQHIGQDPAQ